MLKYIIRIALLIMLIFLGFTAFFPEWMELKDLLIADYNEQRKSRTDEELESHIDKAKIQDCPIQPVTHKINNTRENSNITKKTKQEVDGFPKILLNRHPDVFNNNICEGDTLEYNIYAENVDSIMITYEHSSDTKNVNFQIINSSNFKTHVKHVIPSGMYGKTMITVNGFKKGKVGFSTSKVTFNIKKRYRSNEELQIAEKSKAIKNLPSYRLKWRIGGNEEKHTSVKVVDKVNLHIANSSKSIDSWRMKIILKKDILKPNSRVKLNNNTATIYVKKLSPSKKYEPAIVTNLLGTLISSSVKNGSYTVKLDVIASNNALSDSNQAQLVKEVFYLKGDALIKEYTHESTGDTHQK